MSAMLASQQPIDHLLPPHFGQIPNLAMNQPMAAEQEADPRKLCILGLPWDTTDEALREYFSQFGPLEVAPTHLPGSYNNMVVCKYESYLYL